MCSSIAGQYLPSFHNQNRYHGNKESAAQKEYKGVHQCLQAGSRGDILNTLLCVRLVISWCTVMCIYDHEVYNHATKHDAEERRPWHNRIQYCMEHNEDANVPRVPRQSVRGRGTFGARAMRCTAAGVPSASSYFGAKFYEVLVVWELLETVVAGFNCTT